MSTTPEFDPAQRAEDNEQGDYVAGEQQLHEPTEAEQERDGGEDNDEPEGQQLMSPEDAGRDLTNPKPDTQ